MTVFGALIKNFATMTCGSQGGNVIIENASLTYKSWSCLARFHRSESQPRQQWQESNQFSQHSPLHPVLQTVMISEISSIYQAMRPCSYALQSKVVMCLENTIHWVWSLEKKVLSDFNGAFAKNIKMKKLKSPSQWINYMFSPNKKRIHQKEKVPLWCSVGVRWQNHNTYHTYNMVYVRDNYIPN